MWKLLLLVALGALEAVSASGWDSDQSEERDPNAFASAKAVASPEGAAAKAVATAGGYPQLPPRLKCEVGFELGCAENLCNRTCDAYFNPPNFECLPTFCDELSCVCDPKQDHYLDNGKCIHKEKCPKPHPPKPQCPKGQEKVCDTNCNRTCRDYYFPKKECPKIVCVTTSCMCDRKQGYCLDEKTQKCILCKNCPPPCNCRQYNED